MQDPQINDDGHLGQKRDIEEYNLGGELLLYLPEKGVGVALNSSASAIWSLYDGQLTTVGIAERLAEQLGVSGDASAVRLLVADVRATMTELHRAGILVYSEVSTVEPG